MSAFRTLGKEKKVIISAQKKLKILLQLAQTTFLAILRRSDYFTRH